VVAFGHGDREAAEEGRCRADPRPGSGADSEAGASARTEPARAGAEPALSEASAAPTGGKAAAAGAAGGIILLTLASGQFLMTLDSSVMNVSIATVAKDVGTTVTGIQGAITAYTLVMACLMITGAKVGAIIGRKRAFAIGCVIYGCGSLTTALAPNLPVLLLGWSFLEGVGAALILPAIVALVASNFPAERRPAAYGLVAAAGAVAVAVGPLIGGFATTYFSWRWVFAGEVVLVLVILVLARRIADSPPVAEKPKLDLIGAALSALGLGLFVFGILKSGEWGWIQPREGGPSWAGLSPVIWLILGGLVVLWIFFRWEDHVGARGGEPLVRRVMFKNEQLKGGLTMFLFQYLVQAGVFFVIPLYLSVALGLSAIETGVRILPLSITLLAAAIGVPRVFPRTSPRLIVRSGLLALFLGTVVLMALLDVNSGPEVVLVPLLLIGLGIGALASQLGAVTVSAVPDDQSSEVGGVQNTMTNLGASIGTALAGAILISTLTTAFVANIQKSSAIPERVKQQASTQLSGGVPFISDADLNNALDEAHVPPQQSDAALAAYQDARIAGLESALAILALASVIALFLAQKIPTVQPGAAEEAAPQTSV